MLTRKGVDQTFPLNLVGKSPTTLPKSQQQQLESFFDTQNLVFAI
jgi:hypothetical protein